jgi:peptide methionine sulfoxide reductase msrA/msrB
MTAAPGADGRRILWSGGRSPVTKTGFAGIMLRKNGLAEEDFEVFYDPKRIPYEGLLAAFWRMIDPTDSGGQFADRGSEYTTAIFCHDAQQKLAAEKSRDALQASGRFHKPVVTAIRPAGDFYPAENYHQDYYKKNPIRYKFYRYRSGRDQYLEKTWGKDLHLDYSKYSEAGSNPYHKPSDEELHKRLTSLQYQVTQEEATEPPFETKYWNEKRRDTGNI